MNICFVSPFPPRADGISEFNQDLIHNLKRNPDFTYFGVAINPSDDLQAYSADVKAQVRKNIKADYIKAAEFINNSNADVVCLQLEYALFGGFDGSFIKFLIKDLSKPLVMILHGLPITSYSRRPKVRKNFFKEIAPFVNTFITINPLQKTKLESWGLKNNIVNIYHGAPDDILHYNPAESKKQLHLPDKTIIFNFGLFHSQKGIEYLLAGFKDYREKNADALLIVAGQQLVTDTHQNYLQMLQDYVKKYNLQDSVQLLNRFFERDELYLYLSACDIFVTPYIKRSLVSSGPLSFATLADKFIITTPFPYAKALLSPKEAYFVHYQNSTDIMKALEYYKKYKETKVQDMLRRLALKGNQIKWSSTADSYYQVFKKIQNGQV